MGCWWIFYLWGEAKKLKKLKKRLDNKKLVFILLQKVLWKIGMKRYKTARLHK